MRKLYAFIILGLINSALAAQNWCPPGARWLYHHLSDLTGIDGFAEYSYVKDTMIFGKSCKYIKAAFSGVDWGHYAFHPPTQSWDPVYTRHLTYEEDRTIYVYNYLGGFDTLVSFQSVPGSKWLGPESPYCSRRLQFTVTDTSSLVVNGRRSMIVEATSKYILPHFNDTIDLPFSFVERSFHLQGASSEFGFIPFYCDGPDPTAELPSITFVCYQDDEIGVYNPQSLPCYKGLGVPKAGQPFSGAIKPNPIKDNLTIAIGSYFKVRLVTLSGISVKEFETATDGTYSLETSMLPRGMYFLQFIRNDRIEHLEKLIKD